MRTNRIVASLFLAAMYFLSRTSAFSQTRIDLPTQSRRVDFTNANSTKPARTGSELPPTCSVGELFLLTESATVARLYACAGEGAWTPQGSGITVESNGSPTMPRNTVNFLPGSGVLTAISETDAKINIQLAADTAVLQTRANSQSGSTLLCASASNSSTAYSCFMNPALNTYTPGMVLRWRPDVTTAGGTITLDVDTLGPKAVKLPDGAQDPLPEDIVGGRQYEIWFDGTQFRLPFQSQALVGPANARPPCIEARRGKTWFTLAATGNKDEMWVCAKDAQGTYEWRILY